MSKQTGSISFESTGTISQHVEQNYATLSQIKGQFATSSTGASTAAKVATIVPENTGWTLYTGATVTVKFTSKNTTSAPTLNVNNTGAKPIKNFNGGNLDSDAYNWPAGAAMSFTYDGSSWRLQDSDLMERVHDAESSIEQTATSITSLVSMNDNYIQPDGTTATNNLKSYVNQTAAGITSSVSSTYATKTELSNAASAAEITKSASGERTIVTTDAADLPLLTLSPVVGESIQDGTPTPSTPIYIQAVRGRNLTKPSDAINKNRCTMVIEDDEYVMTASGVDMFIGRAAASGTAYSEQFDGPLIPVISGETYSLSNTNRLFAKNYVGYWDSSKVSLGYVSLGAAAKSFQVPSNAAYMTYRIGVENSTSGTTYRNRIQIEYGPYIHDYVPFNCVAILSQGKNLFHSNVAGVTTNGITFTPLEDGGVKISGTASAQANWCMSKLDINMNLIYVANGTYTASATGLVSGVKFILSGGGQNGFAYTELTSTAPINTSQVIDSTKAFNYFLFRVASGTTVNTTVYFQFERGSTATSYEPYSEHITYIDLKGNELHGLDSTYRDQLDIDASGHAVIEKRCAKVVLDGVNLPMSIRGTDNSSNSYVTCFYTSGPGWAWVFPKPKYGLGSGHTKVVCDKLPVRQNMSYNTSTTPFITPWNDPSAAFIMGFDSAVNTIAEANTWLSNNPVTIVYPLDESAWYTIDLGRVDLPQVTDNSTVYVAAEVQPIISGSWWTKSGQEAGNAHYSSIKENAELRITADGITSEVSKISSAKYVNSAVSFWTLDAIKTYAADDNVTRTWSVDSTTDLRVGDIVYVKCTWSFTENSTNKTAPVYIKTTVESITSATQFTAKSHGYEDALPVNTIKSTINQSADSVKIAANHVDIEGAAIFTSGAYNTATTVVKTETQWYSSTSATSKSDGSWGTTQPSVAAGRYIWQRELVTYADHTVSHPHQEYKPSSDGVCIQADTDLSSVALKTDAIKRTQRIYYRTQTALSTSITGPTTWIGEPGNKYNTTAPTTAITGWSTKPTPLAASTASDAAKYLYLYTCIQTQTVSQAANNDTTCSASTVLLDDTETIIDGGNIITGSIAANQIAANAVTAEKINVTDLQAIGATIGGFQIDTNSIHTKNVAVTSNADNSIALSSADFTRTINSTSRAGLRFAMGDKFGVTGDGIIYASSADISGKITATSGEIGGCTISNGVLQVANANITGTINADKIDVSQINIGDLAGEIGGRNLLGNSNYLVQNQDYTGKSIVAWGGLLPDNKVILLEEITDLSTDYILSFDAKVSNTPIRVQWRFNYISTSNIYKQFSGTLSVLVDSLDWSRYFIKLTTPNEWPSDYLKAAIIVQSQSGSETDYVVVRKFKLEKGSKPTDWTPAPEDIDSAIDDASKVASNYITHIDNNGIKIHPQSGESNRVSIDGSAIWMYRNNYLKAKYADTITLYGGSNASGANPKVELTSEVLRMYDASGNQRFEAGATNGVIIGNPSGGRVTARNDTGVTIYDSSNKKRTAVDASGLHVFDASSTPVEVALFGSTVGTSGTTAYARIGLANSSRFEVTPTSLRAYTSTSTTPFFEVTSTSLKYGTNTAETTAGAQSKADEAAGTATNYIADIDSNKGITVKPSDSSGNDYLQMNSTDIRFVRNNVDVMNLTDSSFRIGQASGYHTTVNTSGLHIWSGTESTPTNELASFGTTARVGATNNAHFVMAEDKLQAFSSTNPTQPYFEVSADGLYYGSTKAADYNILNNLENYVRGMTYFATEDSTAQEGKIYYTRTTVTVYDVSDVTPGMSTSGLYERSNGTYVATSDSVVVAGKTYYEADTNYEYIPYEVSVGGAVIGKYEGTNSGSLAGSVNENATLISQVSEKNLELENRTFGEGGLSENVSNISTELKSAIYINPDPENATVSVGYMDAGRNFVNSHTEVNSNGFDVYYGEVLVGHYGSTISLGDVNGTHMIASGDHMGFVDSTGNEVAYIDIDDNGESVFYMTRSVVVQDMFFGDGKWKFYKRPNNNMSLKWMGD